MDIRSLSTNPSVVLVVYHSQMLEKYYIQMVHSNDMSVRYIAKTLRQQPSVQLYDIRAKGGRRVIVTDGKKKWKFTPEAFKELKNG